MEDKRNDSFDLDSLLMDFCKQTGINRHNRPSLFSDFAALRKKSFRKFIALAVVVALFFGLLGFLIGRASASDYPSGIYALDDILPDPLLTTVKNALENDSSSKVLAAYVSSGYWMVYFIPDTCEPCVSSQTGRLGFSDSENVYGWYQYYGGNVVVSMTSQLPASSQGVFSEAGEEYICTSWDRFYAYDWTCYCDTEMRMFDQFQVPNLVVRDNRILNCYPYEIYGSDYIRVSVSDRFSNMVSVSFNYSDAYGTFEKVFLYDEISAMSGSLVSPAPLLVLQFEPNLLSTSQFTLNSCTYTAAGSYGTKTVSDLNIVFNDDHVLINPDYSNITYISNFTEALSGAGWITGATTIYGGYITDSPVGSWYWDIDNSINQPFGCRVFFLPDYLFNFGGNDLANFSMQNYYSLFEQFDVIVAGVPESYFDFLYGSGAYAAGKTNFLVHGIDFALNEILAASEIPHCLPYENINDSLTITYTAHDVGLLYNRSFLLKQILYSFGDVDSRLLEFETNLLGEDGVLAGLQNQWVMGYELDFDFYNDLLNKLNDIGYAINGLNFDFSDSINQRLDRIIGYLDFDLEVDLSKLSRPWISIFTFAKNMFEDSEPMWDSIGSGADVLYDGLPVSNQYDVEQLPAISGPIPLYPTIAPVPLIPTVSPTLIPLGGG